MIPDFEIRSGYDKTTVSLAPRLTDFLEANYEIERQTQVLREIPL